MVADLSSHICLAPSETRPATLARPSAEGWSKRIHFYFAISEIIRIFALDFD